MTRQQSLEKIKNLTEKFNNFPEKEKNQLNEEQTKSYFIRPLFEALGWNFEEDIYPKTDVSGFAFFNKK